LQATDLAAGGLRDARHPSGSCSSSGLRC